MKKLLIFIISLFVCLTNAKAISASSYIVMDMDNNDVIMGENIHEKRLIASITKIMTCIIAIENGDLDEVVTVDDSIYKAVGSSIYLEVGEKITLKDLLYGMMLRSGNDAATMIARTIAGSMPEFAKMMNDKANELKMDDSYFINSHGLENDKGQGNKSSAYDMAILTSYAMKNKTFRKIFGTQNYTAKSSNKTYSWASKNKLLRYDFITGGKTGFTKKARRTLVTTGTIEGKNIVIVTLNDGNDWNDHKNLYEDIKDNYLKLNILDKDNFKIIDDSVYIEDTLYIKNSFTKIVKKEDVENFKIKYYLKSNINYQDKDNVGSANVYLNDKLIHSEPVYVKVGKVSFWNKVKNWFKNIF